MSKDELYKSFELKNFNNIELIAGNILNTLPEYLDAHNELKISLLHIDADVYEPCKAGLELLFERVVRGGVIVFDDYAVIDGETRAVDEFFDGTGQRPLLKKFSFSHAKPVYMIKD